MSINYEPLKNTPRLLLEAKLKPLQGDRFQPTGFPDLGPARYTRPDGTEMLLVESAQSVANRLELTLWDDATEELQPRFKGLPYILVMQGSRKITNSILEAHRLNSPYVLEGEDKSVFERIRQDAAGLEAGPVKLGQLAKLVFKFDPNAVLHGVFIAKSDLAGGRLRLTRALSGFVEASGASAAESGGVKNDRVDPSGDTKQGFGNVPFHRTEFVSDDINAYFNLDLQLLRAYGLGESATQLLVSLALFKIRRFLTTGLRLRTACDLEMDGDILATRPTSFVLPSETDLSADCERLIGICAKEGLFADPPITTVEWKPSKKAKAVKTEDDESED